jgi:hypothetical protein
MQVSLTLRGSLLHIAWTLPVSYIADINKDTTSNSYLVTPARYVKIIFLRRQQLYPVC